MPGPSQSESMAIVGISRAKGNPQRALIAAAEMLKRTAGRQQWGADAAHNADKVVQSKPENRLSSRVDAEKPASAPASGRSSRALASANKGRHESTQKHAAQNARRPVAFSSQPDQEEKVRPPSDDIRMAPESEARHNAAVKGRLHAEDAARRTDKAASGRQQAPKSQPAGGREPGLPKPAPDGHATSKHDRSADVHSPQGRSDRHARPGSRAEEHSDGPTSPGPPGFSNKASKRPPAAEPVQKPDSKNVQTTIANGEKPADSKAQAPGRNRPASGFDKFPAHRNEAQQRDSNTRQNDAAPGYHEQSRQSAADTTSIPGPQTVVSASQPATAAEKQRVAVPNSSPTAQSSGPRRSGRPNVQDKQASLDANAADAQPGRKVLARDQRAAAGAESQISTGAF